MASVIVRMVHDLVRDAIADVIGKVASKVAIGVLTAGLAAPWTVASVTADVSSWVTRLSKEVADVVLSARNLKGLLERARSLLDDVGAAFGRIPSTVTQVAARVGDEPAGAARQARDFLSSLRPQHALAGAPGTTMAQARQVGRARPTVHTPKNPTTPRPSRPNPNEGRWGQKRNENPTESATKSTTDNGDGTPPGADGDNPMSGPVVFKPFEGASEAEIRDYREYVAGCNRALEADALSPTGRVATTGTAIDRQAKHAARLERMAHPEKYPSPDIVAGHVPDSTWMGRGEPFEWQAMSRRVNSSLGGQNNRYPVGYKPTEFILEEGG